MEKVEIETREEVKKERGAGLIEYAILAAIVVGIAVASRLTISNAASTSFSKLGSSAVAF